MPFGTHLELRPRRNPARFRVSSAHSKVRQPRPVASARDVANVRRSGDAMRRRRPVKESANLWRAEEVEKSRGFGEDGGKAASASDAAVRT